ncbi:Pyridine nucleotide-disulfide oxidoreductase [Teratosphaeria destructans]|uniref:Pyridine nucleotide-disulfide oxidoreductase n=1 Tax=Teratosphaeria destructans TaxID=418781 RepID=A0A9W7W1R3_9PEZI|nr:Pyridine nucleotide-disulfide oxidoreductase [Teratosphaeria destructans]
MAGDKPWPQVPVGNKDHANAAVVIIGAGISGLCLAIDLIKRNNIHNFVILEKSAGIGGTWHDNKYPGCCCDVWSTLYSYSFAQNTEWTREYPGQEEILAYLVKVAQDYNLYQHIRFNTTVEEARWDDDLQKWRTRVTTAAGSKEAEFNPEYEIKSDFLVSAVGQLNQPKWPEIDGLQSFEGKKMHSARWDWSYDLTDKKIALLGNGCTAVQILPEVAKVAKKVTVFQRTPNWVVPRGDAPVTPFMRNVYRYLPPVRWAKRKIMMDFREAAYDAVTNAESSISQQFRDSCLDMMREQIPDQPGMWQKLTPTYNVGCKRIIISDDYYPALNAANVDLETRRIHSISGRAVHVVGEADGAPEAVETDYDLLVCATGFQTTSFMHPIAVYGRHGRALDDIWRDGGRAYMGTTVEDVPNFGMLYGPNTNLGHNSIILMIESQSRYINGLIRAVVAARQAGESLALHPKREKLDAYNARVQAVLMKSSFNDPNCHSWYKNEAGLITNNWSGTVVEYQKLLSEVDLRDYETEGSGKARVQRQGRQYVGRVTEESTYVDYAAVVVGVLSTAALVGGVVARSGVLKAWGVR